MRRHSLHAIAAQLAPAPGCTGIDALHADTFTLHCFQVSSENVTSGDITRCSAEKSITSHRRICSMSGAIQAHENANPLRH